MKRSFPKWSRKRKKILMERLRHDESSIRFSPAFTGSNIHYDFSERISGVSCGGIGAMHILAKRLGLDKKIDRSLSLLKVHKPYFESDHILNMAYNIICGGTCLEDIELLRNNEAYLNALGAERIPDPTTAGDFLRRFGYDDVVILMSVQNQINQLVWDSDQSNRKERDAVIEADGTITGTHGELKEGMDMSYKGIWGFNPLVITEATSGAHLYTVNRAGNVVSHHNATFWIDKSIETVRGHFRNIYLRGDSDFSLTENFDKWDEADVRFCFAFDSRKNLVNKAELLPNSRWKYLPHTEREIKTNPRRKKRNVKKMAIKRRQYRNQERIREYVSEFRYRPVKCAKEYRVVVLKRIIRITKGQLHLMDDTRYFFYITNIEEMSPGEIVHFYNKRCNHENRIEQLYNGVNALKMPASEFIANWAYMVICYLAWNMKSWFGQLMSDRERGAEVIKMKYKRFMNCLINIPCQIIRTGRSTVYRILCWTPWIDVFWNAFRQIKGIRFAVG